jgi:hypothetical protein
MMYGTILLRFLTSVIVLPVVFIHFLAEIFILWSETLRKSRVSGRGKSIGREKGLKWFFSKVAVKACQELTTLAVFQTLSVQVPQTFRKK